MIVCFWGVVLSNSDHMYRSINDSYIYISSKGRIFILIIVYMFVWVGGCEGEDYAGVVLWVLGACQNFLFSYILSVFQ